MSWRSLLITRPARLRIDNRALVVAQEEEARIPLEDIAVIVLDHAQISLTHPTLSACAERGIALYSTGRNHQPNGVHLSFLRHNRSTRRWRQQQTLSRPRVKQLWATIVQRKIENQAACLRLSQQGNTAYLESLARRMRSGDPQNLESQAALVYFSALFGHDFTRRGETWTNSALNYGYTVLRGAIARALVAHGFHPSIGLFHDNERNAFNLADDLIEPFRPLVDLYVVQCTPKNPEQCLQSMDKAALVALLNVDMEMPRGRMSALSAIEQVMESFTKSYETPNKRQKFELPLLIGLDSHEVEI